MDRIFDGLADTLGRGAGWVVPPVGGCCVLWRIEWDMEPLPGCERRDALEHGALPERCADRGEVGRDGDRIGLAYDIWMLKDGWCFRPDDQLATIAGVDCRVVEWFDPHRVAGEYGGACFGIDEDECVHASEFIDCLWAPGDERVEECLGVAAGLKTASECGELGAEIVIVVELAVVCEDVSLVLAEHRLMPGGGEVDDAQAAVPDRTKRPFPEPGVVWAAMGEPIAHALDEGTGDMGRLSVEIQDRGDSTHSVCIGELAGFGVVLGEWVAESVSFSFES